MNSEEARNISTGSSAVAGAAVGVAATQIAGASTLAVVVGVPVAGAVLFGVTAYWLLGGFDEVDYKP